MEPDGVELCLEACLPRQVMLLGVWLTKADGWTETVDKPLRTVLVPFLDMEKGPAARQGSLCLSLAVLLSLSCLWGEVYTFCWFYSNTKHVKQKKYVYSFINNRNICLSGLRLKIFYHITKEWQQPLKCYSISFLTILPGSLSDVPERGAVTSFKAFPAGTEAAWSLGWTISLSSPN